MHYNEIEKCLQDIDKNILDIVAFAFRDNKREIIKACNIIYDSLEIVKHFTKEQYKENN